MKKLSLIALWYVILGLVIAVAGGTVIEKLNMENEVESFIRKLAKDSEATVELEVLTVKDRARFAGEQVGSILKKVFPYIILGVEIGAVIHNWIPEQWVVNILGNRNPFGVIVATIVGALYMQIFLGQFPLQRLFFIRGANLGSILAFMMAVTTLSLPSLIMLRKAVKLKLLCTFIVICTLGIITVGYIFNMFQQYLI